MEKENDETMKKFMLKLLNNADINIVDYDFEIRKVDPSKTPLPQNELKEWRLITLHKTNENGVVKTFKLPFHLESKGTINYFYLGPILKIVLQKGKTVVIDEIDSGLHPLLVEYIIGLFNNREENRKGAQLIFNTHDIAQLSLDIFRRDQIYFVEKNNTTGVSELYSLDEYSPRKTENIRKGYLQGRYGAIPIIGAKEIEW